MILLEVLCKFCASSVQVLYKFCTSSVQVLYKFYGSSVQVLWLVTQTAGLMLNSIEPSSSSNRDAAISRAVVGFFPDVSRDDLASVIL